MRGMLLSGVSAGVAKMDDVIMSVHQARARPAASAHILNFSPQAALSVPASAAPRRLHDIISQVIGNAVRLPLAWTAIGIIGLLDAVWCHMIRFSLTGCAPLVLVMFVLLGINFILRGERKDPKVAIALEVVALWLAFVHLGNVLTYLCATLNLPLQDELLVGIDRSLGFKWLVLFTWVWQHPYVAAILSVCYRSLLPELLILTVWLSSRRNVQRIGEFFWVACLAILLTSTLFAAVPARGAFAYYGVSERLTWMHDLNALRDGSSLSFSLEGMTGIVTFPSFHTVLALLVVYIVRGTGVVGRLFVAWNVLMLFSIPPIGSHYLIDMIGGAVVLAAAIASVRFAGRVQLRRRPHTG